MRARVGARSGSSYDAALEEPRRGASVALAFVELRAGHMALDWAGGPIEAETIRNSSQVRLDSACEAHERTKSARLRVLEPLAEIACTLSNDKTPKPLKQLMSGGETFIVIQHLVECVTLMLIELVRRSKAEPAHIETANTGCSPAPPTTSRRIRGWPRAAPGDRNTMEQ